MRAFTGFFFSLYVCAHATHANEATVIAENIITSEEIATYEPYEYEEEKRKPSKLDIVTESVEFDDPAPYLGLSFVDQNNQNKKWEFHANFGVEYNGEADLALQESSNYYTNLERKRWDIENDSDTLEVNPVFMIEFQYKF